MNRRRMMMLQQVKEEIPRERLVFSNAGAVIAKGVTKTNDGAVICGFAILHQDVYPSTSLQGNKPYYLYMLLVTKSGRNDQAVVASPFAVNAYRRFTDADGIVHSISSTNFACSLFNSIDEGIAYTKAININNLPIMNELTGKSYEGTWVQAGGFHNFEAAQDLLDYYYGVI